jgi:hypothetical protein
MIWIICVSVYALISVIVAIAVYLLIVLSAVLTGGITDKFKYVLLSIGIGVIWPYFVVSWIVNAIKRGSNRNHNGSQSGPC